MNLIPRPEIKFPQVLRHGEGTIDQKSVQIAEKVFPKIKTEDLRVMNLWCRGIMRQVDKKLRINLISLFSALHGGGVL